MGRVAVPTPERVERPVEDRQVLAPVDEARAARVVEVFAPADVHLQQGFRGIEQPARMDVEADPAQKPSEREQVVKETGHQA